MLLSDKQTEEEEAEEAVVARDDPCIESKLAFAYSKDWEHDSQHAKADCYIENSVTFSIKLTETKIEELRDCFLPRHLFYFFLL